MAGRGGIIQPIFRQQMSPPRFNRGGQIVRGGRGGRGGGRGRGRGAAAAAAAPAPAAPAPAAPAPPTAAVNPAAAGAGAGQPEPFQNATPQIQALLRFNASQLIEQSITIKNPAYGQPGQNRRMIPVDLHQKLIKNSYKNDIADDVRRNFLQAFEGADANDDGTEVQNITVVFLLVGAVAKLLNKAYTQYNVAEMREGARNEKFQRSMRTQGLVNIGAHRVVNFNEFNQDFSNTYPVPNNIRNRLQEVTDELLPDDRPQYEPTIDEKYDAMYAESIKYMGARKAGMKKKLARRFNQIRDSLEGQPTLYEKYVLIVLCCIQIAISETLGFTKDAAEQDSETEFQKTEVLKERRQNAEGGLKRAAPDDANVVSEVTSEQKRRRLNQPKLRAAILSGQAQSIRSREEALGPNREGVGGKYIFPAPNEPNTSTREGQQCIANVDRTSGLVIAEYKNMKVVIPKDVLLGFSSGSLNGLYLIYEYADALDEYERQFDMLRESAVQPNRRGQNVHKVTFQDVVRAVEARRAMYTRYKQRNPSGDRLSFAESFYEARNKQYRRSDKGLGRTRQTAKEQVLGTADTRGSRTKYGNVVQKQTKIAKKRAKYKAELQNQAADAGGEAGPGGGGGGPPARGRGRQRQPVQPADVSQIANADAAISRAVEAMAPSGSKKPTKKPRRDSDYINTRKRRKRPTGLEGKQAVTNLNRLTRDQLVQMCRARGLPTDGSKAQLISRLQK